MGFQETVFVYSDPTRALECDCPTREACPSAVSIGHQEGGFPQAASRQGG